MFQLLINLSVTIALLLAALSVEVLGQSSFPSTLKLQGVVRDFSSLHPDFESPVSWATEQRGLFLPQLTADSRPVSMPPQLRTNESLTLFRSRLQNAVPTTSRYAISNFGKMFHDEWYTDVPGVNIALPVEITLNLIDAVNGIYRYRAGAFFPVNGEAGSRGFVRELLDTAPLNQQVNRVNNYWFTTEFRMPFFYRGGETFSFTGDDDLWVFINGKLTSCDLGSIHIARTCTLNLDAYGMLPNSTNEMLILHAERHYLGSSFELTTSIVPVNQAPIATGSSIVVNENTAATFTLQGFDPDYNPNLRFMIMTAPTKGTLSQAQGVWFPLSTTVTYEPTAFYNGADSFTYVMNDGQANSTVATVRIRVNAIDNEPVAIDSALEMEVQQTRTMQLEATDVDTSRQDLRFFLVGRSQFGNVKMDDAFAGVLTYDAVAPGVETIKWQVTDGTYFVDGKTVITVEDPNGLYTTGLLNRPQMAAVIVGVIVVCSIGAAAAAYVLYHCIAAKRFQKQWELEFQSAPQIENPLYKTNRKEFFNPLFEASNRAVNTVVEVPPAPLVPAAIKYEKSKR